MNNTIQSFGTPTMKRQMQVSPAMAANYLMNNKNNRPIDQRRVNKYAQDMTAGLWKSGTFEFIKIDKDGNIIDGQHRLLAILKSGQTIMVDVVFDVNNEIKDVIDSGKPRSAVDIFHLHNVLNANNVASIIKFSYSLGSGIVFNESQVLSNSDFLNILNSNPEFWQDVAKRSQKYYNAFSKVLTKAMFGGFYAHFYKLSPSHAERFMEQLSSGKNIENDIISMLAKYLRDDKSSSSAKRISPEDKVTLIIKCWNHFRLGSTPTRIRLDRGERRPKAI